MNELHFPSAWPSKRLKYLSTYNDEVLSEDTDEEKEIDYVQISGVSLSQGIEEIERMTFDQAPSRARRKVRSGDILISTVRTYLRAIAKIDEASPDLIASTGFCVVRPNNDVDSGFLGWVAKSDPFVSEVVARSVGVSYPAINANDLVAIDIPLPPLTTQRWIARFLDEKTARIDGLIEKKRELLDRLAEKRQALITQAVTKGLNPDAPMKSSGTDRQARMGDRGDAEGFGGMRLNAGMNIPKGWELLPLKRITRFGYGDTLASNEREPGEIKVFGSNGPFDRHTEANTLAPCIIVGRKGSYGKLNYSHEPVFAVDTTFVIDQSHTNADLRFLYYSLGTLGLDGLSDDIAIPGLSREKAYQVLSLLPPLETQRQIARFLDKKTARIDGLVEKILDSIEHLEEYRSAQITAAVTGQLAELR